MKLYKKEATVYKVLNSEKGKLFSCFSPFIKNYKIGFKTKPLKGTKLFAFLDLKEALDYAFSEALVYEARGVGLYKYNWLEYGITDKRQLLDFFKKEQQEPKEFQYKSIICCDFIILTKLFSL